MKFLSCTLTLLALVSGYAEALQWRGKVSHVNYQDLRISEIKLQPVQQKASVTLRGSSGCCDHTKRAEGKTVTLDLDLATREDQGIFGLFQSMKPCQSASFTLSTAGDIDSLTLSTQCCGACHHSCANKVCPQCPKKNEDPHCPGGVCPVEPDEKKPVSDTQNQGGEGPTPTDKQE